MTALCDATILPSPCCPESDLLVDPGPTPTTPNFVSHMPRVHHALKARFLTYMTLRGMRWKYNTKYIYDCFLLRD